MICDQFTSSAGLFHRLEIAFIRVEESFLRPPALRVAQNLALIFVLHVEEDPTQLFVLQVGQNHFPITALHDLVALLRFQLACYIVHSRHSALVPLLPPHYTRFLLTDFVKENLVIRALTTYHGVVTVELNW